MIGSSLKTTNGGGGGGGRGGGGAVLRGRTVVTAGTLEGIAGWRTGCWTEKDVDREEGKKIGFPAMTISLSGVLDEMVCAMGDEVAEGLDWNPMECID